VNITAPLLEENHFFIFGRIKAIWGSLECRDYLRALVIEDHNRPTMDHEFTFGEIREVMELINSHDSEYKMFVPPKSLW